MNVATFIHLELSVSGCDSVTESAAFLKVDIINEDTYSLHSDVIEKVSLVETTLDGSCTRRGVSLLVAALEPF